MSNFERVCLGGALTMIASLYTDANQKDVVALIMALVWSLGGLALIISGAWRGIRDD